MSEEGQTEQQEGAQGEAPDNVQQPAADLPGPGQPTEDVEFDQDTTEKEETKE